ncbi:uncharacterized protein B0I36DRAFT_33149 [Microdochium trichocladiopsis]|uniref:Uncharacterized protein n=1 Tax=Microdochium trichocladiopsis TaxID=1682393 RepID=A0A9P8XZS9_9PEZI|nr:uncharacterized protein B0I36DRAFT_33149 [Microdochium trichocladiopsis]KAH7021578.1 hypothetical protein B0I36DRAFT_33149 [Microdochium trichocladiopsis]
MRPHACIEAKFSTNHKGRQPFTSVQCRCCKTGTIISALAVHLVRSQQTIVLLVRSMIGSVVILLMWDGIPCAWQLLSSHEVEDQRNFLGTLLRAMSHLQLPAMPSGSTVSCVDMNSTIHGWKNRIQAIPSIANGAPHSPGSSRLSSDAPAPTVEASSLVVCFDLSAKARPLTRSLRGDMHAQRCITDCCAVQSRQTLWSPPGRPLLQGRRPMMMFSRPGSSKSPLCSV